MSGYESKCITINRGRQDPAQVAAGRRARVTGGGSAVRYCCGRSARTIIAAVFSYGTWDSAEERGSGEKRRQRAGTGALVQTHGMDGSGGTPSERAGPANICRIVCSVSFIGFQKEDILATTMSSVVKTAKAMILWSAKATRLSRVVRDSRWRSRRLLILAYHGISLDDEHEWDSALYMAQDFFRRRMRSLRDGGYSVLPYEEAVERLYAGDLPPRAVALTFDDGMRDFRVRACPVLAEFGYPATVYVTTYFSGQRYPVFNIFFSYLLWKGRGKTVDLSDIVPGLGRHALDAGGRAAVLRLIRDYRESAKPDNAELAQIARRLANAVGEDYDRLCDRGILHVMSPQELAELPRFGISVQLHTHRHRTPAERAPFLREIQDNRRHLASAGISPEHLNHFCYPSGVHRSELFGWLRSENIRTATTCIAGLASRRSPSLALPRLIDTCNITPLEFEGWLTGVNQFLPRRRHDRF